MDCRLQGFSLESGELIATSSNAGISETENLLSVFYCVSEIYVNFGVCRKKDQSHSLSIMEIINCEKGSRLNVQKAIFHSTPRQITC